jgi:hypothetical protein
MCAESIFWQHPRTAKTRNSPETNHQQQWKQTLSNQNIYFQKDSLAESGII